MLEIPYTTDRLEVNFHSLRIVFDVRIACTGRWHFILARQFNIDVLTSSISKEES